MEYGYIMIIILVVFNMIDIRQHNDKVEKMYPDATDQHQYYYRTELSVSNICNVFILIAAISSFVSSIFGG